VDRLIEGDVPVQVLQLDQVHSRLVGKAAERPPQVVVGDSPPLPAQSAALHGPTEEKVGPRFGAGH
jgi:hypothetical protein